VKFQKSSSNLFGQLNWFAGVKEDVHTLCRKVNATLASVLKLTGGTQKVAPKTIMKDIMDTRAFFVVYMLSIIYSIHGMESTNYTLLDGKKVANIIEEKLKKKVDNWSAKNNMKVPHLSIILVGEDAASKTYVKNKLEACKRVGFLGTLDKQPQDITEDELCEKIKHVNENNDIDGLIVQLPLPSHINAEKIIGAISPVKDVDGLHPVNMGRLRWREQGYLPATAHGILKLLKFYNIETQGKHCVVVGGSQIVGYPISTLLAREECLKKVDESFCRCTVTQCHKHTQNLPSLTCLADILIVATGKHNLITDDMVKEGAVVIDVGMHRIKSERASQRFVLEGDVAFKTVKNKCSYITPVPGGVGPLTVAALLSNTLKAAQNNKQV
jgi:methylenetetrahydrofolate dehydrogenase (NADP+) / methenyltetrahydrofolate cyclohydrolase